MSPTDAQSKGGPAGPPRILVVDDERTLRVAIARTLETHGYAATTAEDAEDALRHFDDKEFDLAIVDISMPRTDGFALLQQIKNRSPQTEVVMLSAYGSIEVALSSLRAGAFDFIEKPYQGEHLTHTVERALEHRRLRKTTALYQAGHVIFTTRDFDRLPEAIVKVSLEVMAADAVTLLLPGIDGAFYVAHAFGLAPEVSKTTRIAMGEGVAGRVALSRKPLLIAGDASQLADLRGVTARTRVRSSIVYPLVLGEQVHGILTFNRLTDEQPFRTADLESAAVLGSQVLLALENSRLARQSATAEKLAAVGQLASGIAHEINTPIQFVSDSLHFLNEAFSDLVGIVDRYEAIEGALAGVEIPEAARSLLRDARERAEETDLAYLREAVPRALQRTAEGTARVTEIVRAVKEFGRPDVREKIAADLNQCLVSTLAVSSGEYKYVADVETIFAELSPVLCHPGELNQVFLNLIVNAGHAIAAVVSGTERRGKIVVRTRAEGQQAVVSIEDTGGGIAPDIQQRVFEPFFTTKAVGRGTGLGLSIARTIIERHGGSLTFDTELGRGTRFSVRLPFHRSAALAPADPQVGGVAHPSMPSAPSA
jgi:two-component system, NtrC family, sensor kinase